MSKFVALSTAVALLSVGALFVPIHPAILQFVGLPGDPPVTPAVLAIQSANAPIASPYASASSLSGADRGAPVPTAAAPQRLPVAAAPRSRFNLAPDIARKPIAEAPVDLIRDLQTELRRVGCYGGRLDGDWGPASRFAMASFTRTVNATLPTDKADVILLSLVRRHAGLACGAMDAQTTMAAAVPRARIQNESWIARVMPARPATVQRLTEGPTIAQRPTGLIGAPRIVRANGITTTASVVITRATGGTLAAGQQQQQQGEGDRPRFSSGTKMSLGAAVPHVTAGPQPPVTLTPPSSGRARRAERPSRQYRPSRRARSKAWKSRVYSAVNLNGQ